jgi:hypothetical protein
VGISKPFTVHKALLRIKNWNLVRGTFSQPENRFYEVKMKLQKSQELEG